ncbi:uncharacterized protein LTR77_005349 [Saxophila tyrrhenica]|uniref:Uncharacterized protein n=1 Tax=Saxophila tyrrhenica TaxID=1690608 RepID=A0AAV9PBP6_9PEZI|nr:hypothetical protein LTR77_005349 [Saxophila tyrrhenica]
MLLQPPFLPFLHAKEHMPPLRSIHTVGHTYEADQGQWRHVWRFFPIGCRRTRARARYLLQTTSLDIKSEHYGHTAGTTTSSPIVRLEDKARIIDRIIPRERFGSSIFSTPVLLLLRLFYDAAPFRYIDVWHTHQANRPRDISQSSLARVKISLEEASKTNGGVPETANGGLRVSTQSWATCLLCGLYPIGSEYRLRSLTWTKSLSAPLSHEFLQFVLEDADAGHAIRLIAERDTYGDWVSIRSSSILDSAGRRISGARSRGVETDEQHDLPLPLLSLSWCHLPAASRPTAGNFASIMGHVTRRWPKYNLSRHHCWFFCEAVFEQMIMDCVSSDDATDRQPRLTTWPGAAYRYSYVVMGRKVLKRAALVYQAQKFSSEMDQDGVLVW